VRCVSRGPAVSAVPVFSLVVIICFGVFPGRTQADVDLCWLAAARMAVGWRERLGAGWRVAGLEVVRSCDVE